MSRCAHRAALLHFTDDPQDAGDAACVYHRDGLLLIEDGRVARAGSAAALLKDLPAKTPVLHHPRALLCPGFIDCHVHYPQLDVVAAHGEQLLEWLEKYVFPAEARFAERTHADAVAARFLDELLRHGTTTAMVFGTVHPQSVDAFFAAAEARNLRMIAGKVMMDRNAPDYLCDTVESSYRDSRDLIARWHGCGRQRYAVTPRFAATSSQRQLAAAGQLLREHPGVYLHTHMSENLNEVAWVASLFPQHDHYLHSYDEAGLLGRRSVFAHCIHLSSVEWQRLADTASNVAFCPSSNLFLGSGLFPLQEATSARLHVGLGTDIGAGTTLSLLATMNEAYKVMQLQGQCLSPLKSFYLATLGAARALDLEPELGNFLPGKEADFLVLDFAATPLLEARIDSCQGLDELLAVLSTLGDDRAVRETWIMGERRYRRTDAAVAPAAH